MVNNEIQNQIVRLFKSRQNCLLLNVSEKNECDTRFNLSILGKLFPFLNTWISFQDDIIYTFICTSQIKEELVELGKFQIGEHGFDQRFYLVKSRRLNALSISLLRTSEFLSTMLSEVLEEFDSITLLDFYPWGTDVFEKSIKRALAPIPFSIAVMDGFNRNAHTEKETRSQEINKVVNVFKGQGHKCLMVNRQFNLTELSYLLPAKSNKLDVLEKEIKERIKLISFCFNDSPWTLINNEIGWKELCTTKCEYTSANIINHYVIPSLKNMLSQQDLILFEKLVPNWKSRLESMFNDYNKRPIPNNRIESILRNRIGNKFAKFVVQQLNIVHHG